MKSSSSIFSLRRLPAKVCSVCVIDLDCLQISALFDSSSLRSISTWVFPRPLPHFPSKVEFSVFSCHLSVPSHLSSFFLILNPTSGIFYPVLRKLNIYGVSNHITILVQSSPDIHFCHDTEDSSSGPEECVDLKGLQRGSHPGVVTAQALWICSRGQWQKGL